jgi:Mg2+-importing ATPase
MAHTAHLATEAGLELVDAAKSSADAVRDALGTPASGLSGAAAAERLRRYGPNAVREHRATALKVLGRQLSSPLLWLLAATAVASVFLGDQTDATIIGTILLVSVALGFANEYRAERTAASLHDRIRHTATTIRDGSPVEVDVTAIVPGDVVRLQLGQVVPADVRLLEVRGLECDESMITGESAAVSKRMDAIPTASSLSDLPNCALMGTVVTAGSAEAVVVATGRQAEFGRIAHDLGTSHPQTDFQVGLRRFSMLLMRVALVLSALILATNLVLGRPLLDAALFALAIAVGITPQLLPAVVSTSLSAGSRSLAKMKVLVKRLVCIEDLGDVDVLVTDKTGTLTAGHISYERSLSPDGKDDDHVRLLAMLASSVEFGADGSVAGGNDLDSALFAAPGADLALVRSARRVAELPFDHDRQLTSVVTDVDGRRRLVVKGAPESVLDRCGVASDSPAAQFLNTLFAAGERVVAVASKAAPGMSTLTASDETGLTLEGFVTFADRPKPDAAAALARLAGLGITVKVATGDNPVVAETVCRELGLDVGGVLTGVQIDGMDDTALTASAQQATVFARVTPDQKARLIRLLRHQGHAVGFLGDGVNDALALHAADVGISVDTGADVAKDAADIILLDKSLDILADGIQGGRRIFANTIKYVMMGTSSNFGNMFSAAGASALLSFLPMLPSQILLNNLLYDASQLTIPTDRVDEEQLRRPSHWDIGFIRRFMLFFGPISSVFDFLTFAVLLGLLHAGPDEFRTGWFVESLATQTLIVFAIRTRRTPFWRSRPSLPLLVGVLAVVAVGVVLPLSPLAGLLGFTPLPAAYFWALTAMVVAYLALIEVGKTWFYAAAEAAHPPLERSHEHRVHRRASRFSAARLGAQSPTTSLPRAMPGRRSPKYRAPRQQGPNP